MRTRQSALLLASATAIALVVLPVHADPLAQTSPKLEESMMKECLARETKKAGTDKAAARAHCQEEREVRRLQSTAPNTGQKPALVTEGDSASGHASHSGVQQSAPSKPAAPSSETK